jgi:glucan phosphorylase
MDGWWEEGYDGTNGWSIPEPPERANDEVFEQDQYDAEHFYRLLEEEVVPLFYDRDASGVPLGWVDRMRNAIRVAGAHFTARRMVLEYTEQYYVPAIRGDRVRDEKPFRPVEAQSA